MKKTVYVTDAPYNAKGDGVTNDRAAIQAAVDDVFAQGGGTVVLTEGRTYLSGNIVLRSGIEFHFGDGATLYQSSSRNDYVKPLDNCEYEPYLPMYGHNVVPGVKWSHAWYFNYPMLFAAEGTHDVKITGNGTICMMPDDEPEKILRICPVGFYRTSNFEVSDITITNYHSYGMMIYTCDHGLFRNITIHKNSHGNGDGIGLMNCQNIRVTECHMFTGDDSVYIFQSYKDPRGGGWWSSDDPQPSLNIEIDHNDLESNHCKAFGMILWGLECPDQEKIEVRNVYVHDNHFKSLGNWNYNPYTEKIGHPPVTTFRFENNVIDTIEENFFETKISDMNGFHSMTEMHNGNFEDGGLAFWAYRKNANEKSVYAGRDSVGQDGEVYGCIDHLDEGDAALYQGLYIKTGEKCTFRAMVQTSGDTCRMFVRNLDSGELIASKEFCNIEWKYEELEFEVPANDNYHIGIERGSAEKGWARIDNARLMGNYEGAFGYKKVIMDDGKVVYVYNED